MMLYFKIIRPVDTNISVYDEKTEVAIRSVISSLERTSFALFVDANN